MMVIHCLEALQQEGLLVLFEGREQIYEDDEPADKGFVIRVEDDVAGVSLFPAIVNEEAHAAHFEDSEIYIENNSKFSLDVHGNRDESEQIVDTHKNCEEIALQDRDDAVVVVTNEVLGEGSLEQLEEDDKELLAVLQKGTCCVFLSKITMLFLNRLPQILSKNNLAVPLGVMLLVFLIMKRTIQTMMTLLP